MRKPEALTLHEEGWSDVTLHEDGWEDTVQHPSMRMTEKASLYEDDWNVIVL
jgi:hypothetical protein